MVDILNKAPIFNPIGVRGSLRKLHTGNSGNSNEEGEDDSNPPPPEKKKKKKQIRRITSYFNRER